MSELSCLQCRGLAAELALNIVTGRERAAALAHLSRCDQCRRRVADLAQTADQLVELLPEIEPPSGFDQRTAARLPSPAPHPHPHPHFRPRVVPIAAALLAAALIAGGWSRGFAPPTSADPPSDHARLGDRTVLYAPLTDHQHLVGQAYLYPGTPSWVYVSVSNADTRADHLDVQLTRPDGTAASVGTIALHQGQGAWGGATSVGTDGLTATALVSPCGHKVGTGEFSRPPRVPDVAPSHPHAQSATAPESGERASFASRGAKERDVPDRDRVRDRAHSAHQDPDQDAHPDSDHDSDHDSEQNTDGYTNISGRDWTPDRNGTPADTSGDDSRSDSRSRDGSARAGAPRSGGNDPRSAGSPQNSQVTGDRTDNSYQPAQTHQSDKTDQSDNKEGSDKSYKSQASVQSHEPDKAHASQPRSAPQGDDHHSKLSPGLPGSSGDPSSASEN